nr:MAG: capsid protein [Astroviridae sp.]
MSEPLPQRRRRSRSKKRAQSRSRSRSKSRGKVPVVRTVATEVKHVQFSSGKPVATANVEREVASTSRVGGRRSRQRNQGSNPVRFTNAEKRLDRAIKNVRRKLNGPAIQDTFSLTLTLGTIDGTADGDLNRQMRYPLNPVLLKIDDSGKATTPLSERAHQYNLWKLLHCSVQLTPLVNASNVTGTVAYVDLDEEGGTVSPETVDTIKAKLHAEVFVGQKVIFTIAAKKLEGPRQTWWWIDTNEEAEEALGPAIDFWTYLPTRNLLGVNVSGAGEQTTTYTGPLWLAEMRVKYAFSNYMPKPALAQLTNEKLDVHNLTFESGTNGELIISGTSNAQLFKASGVGKVKAVSRIQYADSALSTAIYLWVDDGIKTLAPSLGVWGWLLKAGWFVVRQILPGTTDLANANSFRAVVYPSVKAAQDHEPVQVGSLSAVNFRKLTVAESHPRIQQINAPNVNNPSEVSFGEQVQTVSGQIAYPLVSPERRERAVFNLDAKPPAQIAGSFSADGPSSMMRIRFVGASSQLASNPDVTNSGFSFSVALETNSGYGQEQTNYTYRVPSTSSSPEQVTKSLCPALRFWKTSDPACHLLTTGLSGTLLQNTSINSSVAGDLTSLCETLKADEPNELNGFFWVSKFNLSTPLPGNTQNRRPMVWANLSSGTRTFTALSDLAIELGASQEWESLLDETPSRRLYMMPVVNPVTNLLDQGLTVNPLLLNGVLLVCPVLGEALWFGYHRFLRTTASIAGPANYDTTLFYCWNTDGVTPVPPNWLKEVQQKYPSDEDDDISLQDLIDECDFSVNAFYESPERSISFEAVTDKTLREERDYWRDLAKSLMLKNSQQ